MRWFFYVNNLMKKSTLPTFVTPVLLLQFARALQGGLATETPFSPPQNGGGGGGEGLY